MTFSKPAIHDQKVSHSLRVIPLNPNLGGNPDVRILLNTRVMKSPFWVDCLTQGVYAATIRNNYFHPTAYVSPEDGGILAEYQQMTKGVALWNVAVERQVRLKGAGALDLADLLFSRNLKDAFDVGQCRYAIMCDQSGGIINDPVILRIADDEIWLSTSEPEVLFWVAGINLGFGFDVQISEIDVSPIQLQGPKSRPLMESLVDSGQIDSAVLDLEYYEFCEARFESFSVIVARTGYSTEMCYEIYLRDAVRDGREFWKTLVAAGEPFGLVVGAPNHMRRLEAGILSFNQDFSVQTTPFEVGLEWLVDMDKPSFIGKDALMRIAANGVQIKLVGMIIGGSPLTWYNPDNWPVFSEDGLDRLGHITTALWSPKLETNIALAFLPVSHSDPGRRLRVWLPDEDGFVDGRVVDRPFVK